MIFNTYPIYILLISISNELPINPVSLYGFLWYSMGKGKGASPPRAGPDSGVERIPLATRYIAYAVRMDDWNSPELPPCDKCTVC